jgi:hypothetical protein
VLNIEAYQARRSRRWIVTAGLVAIPAGALSLLLNGQRPEIPPAGPPPAPPAQPLQVAADAPRTEPARFPPRSCLPPVRESTACGAIDLDSFSPGRELTWVDDARVWWESDHDTAGEEDDHSMHRVIEAPLRKLVELVCREGGTLEVHDAYRPGGVHSDRSLHREGRALDVTCDQFPLEKLAKLCWVAGFDWVLYERGVKTGPHVHCSMRRQGR